MKFKVGDRVEAIKGPSNTQHHDYIGPGTITAIYPEDWRGEKYMLDLDMGEKGWCFAEESLRPLKTPKPSITVGTQVRLTGVVREIQPNGVVGVDIYVGCQDGLHWFKPSEVEVIRQPFKRGEVVRHGEDDEGKADGADYVVVNDETNGNVDVVNCQTLESFDHANADLYERRP